MQIILTFARGELRAIETRLRQKYHDAESSIEALFEKAVLREALPPNNPIQPTPKAGG